MNRFPSNVPGGFMTTIIAEEDIPIIREGETASRFEWGAALAGGVIAAGATFFLVLVGAALGLSLAGTRNATGAHSFLTIGAIYFLAAQAFGFAIGGYVTGRLMAPMPETPDEHFRADVHGLGVWSLAVVIGLSFAGLAGVAGLSHAAPSASQPTAYWSDRLLSDAPAADYAARNAEVSRLLAADTARPAGRAQDPELVTLVARLDGISPATAAGRVAEVENDIRAEADAARKALLYFVMWTCFALLLGAFAAIAATVMARFHEKDVRFGPF
jgi:hypothetical protein